MKKHKMAALEKATWLFAFLPLAVTLAVMPALPDIVPAHYGASGTANRMGSKYELLLLPFFTALWPLFFYLIGRLNEKSGEASAGSRKALLIAALSSVLVFNVLSYVFLYEAATKASSLSGIGLNRVIAMLLAATDVAIGNYLPKCTPNACVGIRLPWTLANDEVWEMTHRFGGKVFVVTGMAVFAACSFVPDVCTLWLYLASMLIAVVVLCIYAAHTYGRIVRPGGKE